MPPIRILIADDHAMFREAIARILEAEGHFAVVGQAGDGEALVTIAQKTPADVLLLDLDMPRLSGLEALRRLRRSGIAIRTILLTARVSPPEVEEALRLGVRGVVGKETPLALLAKSIQHVAAGEYWIGHERTAELIEAVNGTAKQAPSWPADLLTRREKEMVEAVLHARGNREIGEKFGIGEQTVKNHLSRIFTKLGVANRLELALFAVSHHVVAGPRPES